MASSHPGIVSSEVKSSKSQTHCHVIAARRFPSANGPGIRMSRELGGGEVTSDSKPGQFGRYNPMNFVLLDLPPLRP
jgi:hypothetical protein